MSLNHSFTNSIGSIDSSDSYALTPTHKAGSKVIKRQKIIMTMQCLWNFDPQSPQELSLVKGDVVYVTDCLGDWSVGICERTSTKGYFPPNYCTELEGDDIPMPRNEALRSILIFPEDEEREAAEVIWRAYSKYKYRKAVKKALAKVRHRRAAFHELMEGEKTYVEFMTTLKELYSTPLKQKLSADEHKQIFKHLEVVVNVANIFLQDLENANMDDTKIMNIFVKNSAILKQYGDFVNNIDNATALIDAKCQKDKEFKEFLKLQKSSKRSNRQDLKSLLAKPFQRLIGYRNLIDRIRQLTPVESFKYEQLEHAYQQIESTIEHINERRRFFDDQKTMIRIQNALMDKGGAGKLNLIRGWRTLLHEGKLLIQRSDMNNYVSMPAFLMSDIFFFVKDKELCLFYLAFTKISKEKDSPLVLKLEGFKQKCSIKFKDEAESEAWQKHFTNAYESEISYAKENDIHGSVHNMISDYTNIFHHELKKISEAFQSKRELHEQSEREIAKSNATIADKKRDIEILLKEIISCQNYRKNKRMEIDGTKKELYNLKKNKEQNLEKCINFLQTFNLILRRDADAYQELFGEDRRVLTEEMKMMESMNLNLTVYNNPEEKAEDTSLLKTIENHSASLGSEFDEEMRSIKKLVQGIELDEDSFHMITSAAELRKKLQESKKQNLELAQKAEELKRILRMKEEALVEERSRITSYLNDSHSTDQIQLLTKTLEETEKKLMEIQGWKDQQMQLLQFPSMDKDLFGGEMEKLKEENEKLKAEMQRLAKENDLLRKDPDQRRALSSKSVLSPRGNIASPRPDGDAPPIPPRGVATSSTKDQTNNFEDKSKPPPPLPSRELRYPNMDTKSSTKNDSNSLTIEVPNVTFSPEKSADSNEATKRQLKKAQLDDLQNEIVELRRKLDDSRKEKMKVLDEGRERLKKLLAFHEDQLKHFTETQEKMHRNNQALSEVLQSERSKAAQYERKLLEIEKEKFEELERSWEKERVLDELKSMVEKLRIELIQSQYKISYLEKLPSENVPPKNDESAKLHRRSSASELPKENMLSPNRASRRMSMAMNATTLSELSTLLNQKSMAFASPDRPLPMEAKRSVSPIRSRHPQPLGNVQVLEEDDLIHVSNTSPAIVNSTQPTQSKMSSMSQSIDVSSEMETSTESKEKKKYMMGFFSRKKRSPSKNDYRNTLSLAASSDTNSQNRFAKSKSMSTSASMPQFPQPSSPTSSTSQTGSFGTTSSGAPSSTSNPTTSINPTPSTATTTTTTTTTTATTTTTNTSNPTSTTTNTAELSPPKTNASSSSTTTSTPTNPSLGAPSSTTNRFSMGGVPGPAMMAPNMMAELQERLRKKQG